MLTQDRLHRAGYRGGLIAGVVDGELAPADRRQLLALLPHLTPTASYPTASLLVAKVAIHSLLAWHVVQG